jgi:hypothetical protein
MIANLIAWLIILAIVLMPIALLIIWVAGAVVVTRAIILSLRARLPDGIRCGPPLRRPPIPVKIRATKFVNVVVITVGDANNLGSWRCRRQAAHSAGNRENGAEINTLRLNLRRWHTG